MGDAACKVDRPALGRGEKLPLEGVFDSSTGKEPGVAIAPRLD